ncbi:MAG: cytochrome P450 [Actinobacteria bacterium]|nr:cytochrome P450 [Actinomycetota bacterium]
MPNETRAGEVGEFTNHDPAATPADSYARYAEWRGRCPVAHSDAFDGFYLFNRYADVRAAAKDWQTYSSAEGFTLPPLPVRAWAIGADPPLHTRERGLFKEILNNDMYRTFEEHAVEDATRLIGAFLPAGEVDLVAALCEPIPVLTICGMIGLDADEALRVRPVAMETFEATNDTSLMITANARFNAAVKEFSDARRAAPRDDFMTRVATEPIEGAMFSDDEIGNLLQGILIAGHHTTTSAMSSLFRRILTETGLKQKLIDDPDLIRAAVEETLRLNTPLHMFGRTTRCPVTVAGVDVPDRSFVMLNWASANRDPEQFESPDEFRLDRSPNPHLAFGVGVHTCIGAQLARIELQVVTRELLGRVPDIELAAEPPDYVFSGGNLAVLPELRAQFEPRDSAHCA